eukprot:gnl/TRDRNA2_/TRDRNA2_171437_c0_seq11.p1 gnl/TRDRNA2_/TRDRNA2_171437_c0~~gnl/TRDRNA2_/TRDRNA2_171437_c0_seq11.p1  ORF type:complete len:371 (+),score=106.66 gnl/TRDRNA2_/TRDRNA2_171437_c0_seq11:945-2057(+)
MRIVNASRKQTVRIDDLQLGSVDFLQLDVQGGELLALQHALHTLKQVLEFAQECKKEGNLKFKEGLYEDALFIYTQGDDVLKKWKVEKHLVHERKWLKDYHLACLKNKAQAALKLEKFATALDAAEAALEMEAEDHKAWYRKVQALKGLGRFKEAEEALARLEEVAEWCPDRLQILRDCEAERKRLSYQTEKHKQGTQKMLRKAFQSGVFSNDRVDEIKGEEEQQEQIQQEEGIAPPPRLPEAPSSQRAQNRPLERTVRLTAALAGDLLDELAVGYSDAGYQARVHKCARDSGYEKAVFLMRLKRVAFEVQKPIIEKWGFEGSEHGLREMTVAVREASSPVLPEWLKKKQDSCLEKLYGGPEGGMLDVLM